MSDDRRVKLGVLLPLAFFCLLIAALAPRFSHAASQGSPSLRADPPRIVFSASAASSAATTLRIHNDGARAIRIESLGLRGGDWGGFTIVDEQNAQVIEAHDFVDVHISADPKAFSLADADAHEEFRSGKSNLELRYTGGQLKVPLTFAADREPYTGLRIAVLLGWCLLLSWFGRTPSWLPALASRRWLLYLGTLICVCAMPLAMGWCSGAQADSFGELALKRCRAGIGGTSLALVLAPRSALWLFTGLAIATVARSGSGASPARLLRLATCFVTLGLLSLEVGSWDLAQWMGSEFHPHPGLAIALLIAWSQVLRIDGDRGDKGDSVMDPLDALLWSLVFAGVFLAGPAHHLFSPGPGGQLLFALAGLPLFALKALAAFGVVKRMTTIRTLEDRFGGGLALFAMLGDLLWSFSQRLS